MTYGLSPRPEVAPEELAVVTAIAQALLTPTVVAEVRDETPKYRFSGRWWHPGHRAGQ